MISIGESASSYEYIQNEFPFQHNDIFKRRKIFFIQAKKIHLN